MPISPSGPADRASLLPKYEALRDLHLDVGHKLFQIATKDEVLAAGRRLGLARGSRLHAPTDADASALTEFTLYHTRRAGASLFEIAETLIDLAQPELRMCTALSASRWGIFTVIDTEPGVGMTLRDQWSNVSNFTYSTIGSRNVVTDQTLVCRLITCENITQLSTTVITVRSDIEATVRSLQASHELPALDRLLEGCKAGQDLCRDLIATSWRKRHQNAATAPSSSPGRNTPCPCGSGKKFKRCCGK